MAVPVAQFEDFDPASTGLDSLTDGVAANAHQGGLAVMHP